MRIEANISISRVIALEVYSCPLVTAISFQLYAVPELFLLISLSGKYLPLIIQKSLDSFRILEMLCTVCQKLNTFGKVNFMVEHSSS